MRKKKDETYPTVKYSSHNGQGEKTEDRRHPGIDAHPGDLVRVPGGAVRPIKCVLYAGEPEAAEVRYYIDGCKNRSFFWGEEITLVKRKEEEK